MNEIELQAPLNVFDIGPSMRVGVADIFCH